jgi:flagellar biosynthetic protein FlhB
MAEGSEQEDKTEEPSPKKLREAREKGQVVQSREVNTWIMLFTAALLFAWAGVWLCSNLTTLLSQFIARPETFPADGRSLTEITFRTFLESAKYLGVILIVLFIAALLSGLAQVGPLYTTETLKPSLDKINPMKGFKRIFGGKAWIEFIKAFCKMLLIAVVTTVALIPIFSEAPGMVGISIPSMMDILRHETKGLFISVLAILFVLAVADYAVQYFQMMKQLRMSKQELRDEYKQTEGDPHIKSKLRELRLQRARKRMMAAVPSADVVITNPTHFSIALEYKQDGNSAPIVVAKGQDNIALKIREIAKENNVPIVQNAPLARAMYDSVDLDQEIPEEHYKAVAEIISYVFSLKRK